MMKRSVSWILTFAFLFGCYSWALAAETGHGFGIGYQFSRPADGFSLKIPVTDTIYLQPIFAFGMTEKKEPAPNSTQGSFAFGLRGTYDLPARGDFQPYAGLAIGHHEEFSGTTPESTTATKGGTGYEIFLGVEYQKWLIRPAVEIGLGGFDKIEGGFLAGTTFNVGVMYYF